MPDFCLRYPVWKPMNQAQYVEGKASESRSLENRYCKYNSP